MGHHVCALVRDPVPGQPAYHVGERLPPWQRPPLRLRATDPSLGTAGEWVMERMSAGVRWRHGRAPADAAVHAPARELLLVLYRRLDPAWDGVEITGDRALFRHWQEHSRF